LQVYILHLVIYGFYSSNDTITICYIRLHQGFSKNFPR
jgi:hypothetical protein